VAGRRYSRHCPAPDSLFDFVLSPCSSLVNREVVALCTNAMVVPRKHLLSMRFAFDSTSLGKNFSARFSVGKFFRLILRVLEGGGARTMESVPDLRFSGCLLLNGKHGRQAAALALINCRLPPSLLTQWKGEPT
jgi:hypothetical protein